MTDEPDVAIPLLKAWAAWDRACDRRRIERDAMWRSPSVEVTGDLEDALRVFAAVVGLNTRQARELMASCRRTGATRMSLDRRTGNRWALAAIAGHT